MLDIWTTYIEIIKCFKSTYMIWLSLQKKIFLRTFVHKKIKLEQTIEGASSY